MEARFLTTIRNKKVKYAFKTSSLGGTESAGSKEESQGVKRKTRSIRGRGKRDLKELKKVRKK